MNLFCLKGEVYKGHKDIFKVLIGPPCTFYSLIVTKSNSFYCNDFVQIPDSWTNPTNNYRVGVKHAFDLYPERLRERIQEEYKQDQWDCQHKTTLAAVNREIAKFEAKQTSMHFRNRIYLSDFDFC